MTFNPKVWYPIAVVLSGVNLIFVGVYAAEPGHAAAHGVVALAFGWWAQRLRRVSGTLRDGSVGELQAGFEALDAEVTKLRQELNETQERLDFAERMLAQGREGRRVGGGGEGGPER